MNCDKTQADQVFSEARRDPGEGEIERRNALHVYGLDLLTTWDLRCYFKPKQGNVRIEWINDSACNVEYETEEKALEAVHRLKRSSPSDGSGWYQGSPVKRKGISVQLSFRFATSMDTKDNMKTKESQFLCRASKKRARDAILKDGQKQGEKKSNGRSKIRKNRHRNKRRAQKKKQKNFIDKWVEATVKTMSEVLEVNDEEDSDSNLMESN
eukprot:g2756.t1